MTSESGVPELPSRFTLPFSKRWEAASDNRIPDAKGYECCYGLSDIEASWLKDLINAVYTPETGLRDRLEKAEARVKELEDDLARCSYDHG